MMLRSNAHPDGHVYLHKIENTGISNFRIGDIRFYPQDRSKVAQYSIEIFGLTDERLLLSDSTLMVYFFQKASAGYGYQGYLDVPVLGGYTGLHIHIFTQKASTGQKIVPIGVHSGVFPVFIFEGLKLTVTPGGEVDEVEDKDAARGEHLLLSFGQVTGSFYGGPDDPPKPPRITTFFSYDPVTWALETLAVQQPTMEHGAASPPFNALEHFTINLPAMLDGFLEEMQYTQWPKQYGNDAFTVSAPAMMDGFLEVMSYSQWPNQSGNTGIAIEALTMMNGFIEEMIYTGLTMQEQPLHVNAPLMLDGFLEEL